eukprot:CAMPEP_0172802984 /NCGR_PEP_ID=MMETSP1075-20121228/4205_1 /TAXON_ID=2916 /ORGANISM="Ceratium fusus, Strain PA161109" /LENGTH=248 /DNA_ID=CAMNT_0013641327 /DNA_START=43 /DNA_END=789 /DNA_ORIENTATION=-
MAAESMLWDQTALESSSGAIVGRDEFEALERRLVKAEQTIRAQETQIKLLQTRLASPLTTMSPVTSLFPERSRSPMGRIAAPRAKHGAAPVKLSPVEDPTKLMAAVDEFAMANGLDPKCHEALTSQPPEVQHHVISQGPAEGRNPSAMVMSRIAKCSSLAGQNGRGASVVGPILSAGFMNGGQALDGFQALESLDDFLLHNNLDENCSETLRNQSFECQTAVIAQGPAEGRNPSAMVMGRIAKYMRGH